MKSRSTPAVPARRSPLPALALALALLCACFTACSGPTYSLKRFQNYSFGAAEAGRELSKGHFVEVSKPRSMFAVPDDAISFTGSKPPRQLRQDITFTQYLHTKYKIKSMVLPKASYDFISGYNAVMTAALRERYGDNYDERAKKEFFPDWDKGDSARIRRSR